MIPASSGSDGKGKRICIYELATGVAVMVAMDAAATILINGVYFTGDE